MAIAGTIERTSAITLPRVLERIFDHEQPGSLRLLHKESGRTAIVQIDRGAVQETIFGELHGDAAMREISRTFPWEYEFESWDTSITTGRLPVQPTARVGKKPALKLVGAVKPMMVLSGLTTAAAAAPPSPETTRVPVCESPASPAVETSDRKSSSKFMRKKADVQPDPAPGKPGLATGPSVPIVAAKAAPQPPSPLRRVSSLPSVASLAEWVGAGDEYGLRFARSEALTLGAVGKQELDYFRDDCASLLERAGLIGGVLGFSPPSLAAIVEPERAAGYRRLSDGFAGVYCGADCAVDALLSIP